MVHRSSALRGLSPVPIATICRCPSSKVCHSTQTTRYAATAPAYGWPPVGPSGAETSSSAVSSNMVTALDAIRDGEGNRGGGRAAAQREGRHVRGEQARAPARRRPRFASTAPLAR